MSTVNWMSRVIHEYIKYMSIVNYISELKWISIVSALSTVGNCTVRILFHNNLSEYFCKHLV